MNQNSFLKNFMDMRAKLRAEPNAAPPKRDIKAIGKPAKETSLEELIHDKPSPKVVTEYFRKRVNQLFED
jgi:hypothetical protein